MYSYDDRCGYFGVWIGGGCFGTGEVNERLIVSLSHLLLQRMNGMFVVCKVIMIGRSRFYG